MIYVAVAAFVVSVLAPVAWLFIMSISNANDLTTIPLRWIPAEPDFSRYARLFSLEEGSAGLAFLSALRNSIVVAVSATVIALAAGIPAAYSFSRFPGRMPLLYAVIVTYMMPPVALILPLYKVFSTLGLLNNVTSLIIVYCTILLPFVTWLMKSGFDGVPVEIEQAASIDGASLFQILRYITLPVAAASTGAAALFALLLAWDEFFYALLYTSDTRAKTLPVAIADFAAGRATDYGLISAVGLLAALPPVLIGFFLQKSLLSGLSAGSVKG
ncbi:MULTISPECIES: carbohydrate ABC transporter permease [Phyllobacteriaceae]|jgi:multiple sugar transport system permease protein|uniref:Sugar ABC transporter permease n=1 Tax=Mesorhizobium hungaricum TaxID=1566387 RepID=A0A1C2DYL8_9HYPH|nr:MULTISPECIES: carbohydrate ABC transporter permease [Mesorhizobium]MBN9234721.1 carbohydrate ABC transporter permease [Mesorhizobium sp.]OCX19857.1 sugar ABC transporter permease [Mesorhizobium hungaricum]